MDKIKEIVLKAQKDPAFTKQLQSSFDKAVEPYRLSTKEKVMVKEELGKVGIIFY